MKDIEIEYFPIGQLTSFYPFYVIGYFMKKYHTVYRALLNQYIYLPAMILVIIAWISSISNHLLAMFTGYIGAMSAVIVLWMFSSEIREQSWAGKILCMIGRNTLPIYAIHYLFIAPLPNVINMYLDVNMGLVLQFMAVAVYAAIIMALSLGVDRIISYNRWSRLLFFGEFSKREL